MKTISLSDQHEKPGSINQQTKIILFSRDKAGGQLITDTLAKIPKDYLSNEHIIYITDISAMPGLISKYMAIPSMRKKTFPILLDKEGDVTAKFPDMDDSATIIFLESLKIITIKHIQSAKEIEKLLNFKP